MSYQVRISNSNSTTGSPFGSNDSFSWICHDIMIATAQLKTLLGIRIGREVVFFFLLQQMWQKKEGEARTKKSKKKRMKINRWLQWRLWQFEQQCLKYTAAATVCNSTRSSTASVTSLVELEKPECLYWRFVFMTHQSTNHNYFTSKGLQSVLFSIFSIFCF